MIFPTYHPPGLDSVVGKIIYILIFAAVAHLATLAIRHLSTKIVNYKTGRVSPQTRSIASLANSFIVFSIYFWVIGFILQTLGVSLTAYLASASVIVLAVGFGSQGLVQDVVTGLTLVFSNLIDIGDMVEITGQTGIIRSIGMRFLNFTGWDLYDYWYVNESACRFGRSRDGIATRTFRACSALRSKY